MRFFIPTLAAAIALLSVVSAIPAPPSPGSDNSALQDGAAKPDAAQATPAQVGQTLDPEALKALKQMLDSTLSRSPLRSPGAALDIPEVVTGPDPVLPIQRGGSSM